LKNTSVDSGYALLIGAELEKKWEHLKADPDALRGEVDKFLFSMNLPLRGHVRKSPFEFP
jgi:hypothetical protein